MKAMLTGFVAMFVIAVAAEFILNEVGYSSQDQFSGSAVRLD